MPKAKGNPVWRGPCVGANRHRRRQAVHGDTRARYPVGASLDSGASSGPQRLCLAGLRSVDHREKGRHPEVALGSPREGTPGHRFRGESWPVGFKAGTIGPFPAASLLLRAV